MCCCNGMSTELYAEVTKITDVVNRPLKLEHRTHTQAAKQNRIVSYCRCIL